MEKYGTPAELLIGSFKNKKFVRRICLEDAALTGTKLTYANMDYETGMAAALFKSFYINPGDTVSLLLEDGIHFFMPWLGAMRIGAMAHPINYLYAAEQVLYALELCETKLLVIQERYAWDDFKNRPSEYMLRIREKFPDLKIVVMHDPAKFGAEIKEKENGAGYLGTFSWKTLMQFMHSYDHVAHRYLEDSFQLICTSGTTGRPKAVVQHCGMLEPNVRDLIEVYKLTEHDRTLLINRLFHVNAQVTNFFPMVLLGGRTVLGAKDPKKFFETARKHKITYSSVIPPTLKYLDWRALKRNPLKRLRFLIVGADILQKDLHREFMETTGIYVRPGWGMTETLCWGSATPVCEPIIYGSIGYALPHTKMKIVDPEKNWEEVRDGELGRLIVSGENVFNEYFKNPEATEKAFAPSEKHGEGWFDTGDTCYKAKPHYPEQNTPFHFVGRASADSWKVRGEFVLGTEIDDFIRKNPGLEDAMAVPIAIGGETETAVCVVLKPDNIEPDAELPGSIAEFAIMQYCEKGRQEGRIGKHIKIKEIIFVPKIELGDTGKKSRKKMAEVAQKYIDARLTEV